MSTGAGLFAVFARRGVFDPVTARRYTSIARPKVTDPTGPHLVESMHDLETLSLVFYRFAELECPGMSALYESLCHGIAEDSDVLAIAANARPGQPVPNLFMAAVHWLLMRGCEHPVSAYYPDLTPGPVEPGDPYPSFRSFCLNQREEITALISVRLVQTNVVRRCAVLLPAFAEAIGEARERRLSLVAIGASAGLNLFWDRYAYSYSDGRRWGDGGSSVQLSSVVRGEGRPPLPTSIPDVGFRLGLDLNPVDIRDPDAVAWLKALVWPERREEALILDNAIELAQDNPPHLLTGDALELLSEVLRGIPPDSTLCLYHSHMLNQLSPQARGRFEEIIDQHGAVRDLNLISLEGRAGGHHSAIELTQYQSGSKTTRHLADCDSHGNWIQWLESGSL